MYPRYMKWFPFSRTELGTIEKALRRYDADAPSELTRLLLFSLQEMLAEQERWRGLTNQDECPDNSSDE